MTLIKITGKERRTLIGLMSNFTNTSKQFATHIFHYDNREDAVFDIVNAYEDIKEFGGSLEYNRILKINEAQAELIG